MAIGEIVQSIRYDIPAAAKLPVTSRNVLPGKAVAAIQFHGAPNDPARPANTAACAWVGEGWRLVYGQRRPWSGRRRSGCGALTPDPVAPVSLGAPLLVEGD